LGLAALPLVLAACGQSVILAKPTESVVAKFVFQHTGFRPRDVTCPSGEPAKVGRAFQCHFTGPDGKYIAYMSVTSTQGTRVDYQIQTERVGQTIDAGQAERLVARFVLTHTGHRAIRVVCPSGVAPLIGHTLSCSFTGPDGAYRASLLITGVNRGSVYYRVQTRRVGPRGSTAKSIY
jgi:hypothetical protein